jgi:hypothetical protein
MAVQSGRHTLSLDLIRRDVLLLEQDWISSIWVTVPVMK